MKDTIDPKKIIVYQMVCDTCGHYQVDNVVWTHCLVRGCKGKYDVVADNPGGV